jgi:small-conductance mechanosensitive channel
MNSQSSNPIPPVNPSSSTYQEWREKRRAERWARREARWQRHAGRHTGWFAGALLIALGVILLLDQLRIPFVANGWAVFLLIPAFWAYIAAWDSYQDAYRLTRRVVGAMTVGILLTVLTIVFLLNMAVGSLWPILLIVGGLALLFTSILPE